MPTKHFRQFEFANESAARNAAASIAVPDGFDSNRKVGKRMLVSADKIKPTTAMVSARRRFDDQENPIGWVISVEESDVERRAALAPLAVSSRLVERTEVVVPDLPVLEDSETVAPVIADPEIE